ncbi:MAG: hypothetical protein MHPSP_003542, partial [Paramarteilia canceri]
MSNNNPQTIQIFKEEVIVNLYGMHQTAINLALGLSCRKEFMVILKIDHSTIFKIADQVRMAAVSMANFTIIAYDSSKTSFNDIGLLASLNMDIFLSNDTNIQKMQDSS